MPWWGWLILACVVLVVAAWVAVSVISTRAMRRIGTSFDAHFDDVRRRGPYGGRR